MKKDQIERKVLGYIRDNDLFERNVLSIVQLTFKGLRSHNISRTKITNAIHALEGKGKLKVVNNTVKNTQIMLEGTFVKNKNGNGTITVKQGHEFVEYYVPKKHAGKAQNGDLVSFAASGKDGTLGIINKVLKATSNLVYGAVEFDEGKKVFKFIPDDNRFVGGIDLIQNDFAKLADGKRVSVTLMYDGAHGDKALCQIENKEQIFGSLNNPMASIQSLIESSNVKTIFPQSVLEEASKINPVVSKLDFKNRVDLTHLNFVTIDPDTCKDMDDALYAKTRIVNGEKVGYKLYVAIADVANYVKLGTKLDQEAFSRGTSIYPAGGVIPMLPETLSNGICSLNPHVDRLAMVTVMDVDLKGNIERFDVFNAVINSKHKFSYEEVSALHANEEKAMEEFAEYKEQIEVLYDLEKAFAKKAHKNGNLRIKGYEPTIVLNEEKDKILDYRNDNEVDSHVVIERAMVANNEVIATLLNKLYINNILRTHEEPDENSFDKLTGKLEALGVDAEGEPNNKTYQKLLDQIKDRDINKTLNDIIIRSMKKAGYTPEPSIGHFALGLSNYTHFTSPIRRYVDLVEHRLIKDVLNIFEETATKHNIDTKGKTVSDLMDTMKHYAAARFRNLASFEKLEGACVHLNNKEIAADDLSQKTDLACAALYMQDKVGEVMNSYISKIEKDKLTVTLFDPEDKLHSDIIEVMVPFDELKNSKQLKVGEFGATITHNRNGGIKYQLGDKMAVKITLADPNTRIITATTDLTKELNQEQGEEMNK